jgi:hypothetical protein
LHILQGDHSLVTAPIEYNHLKDCNYEVIVGRTTTGQFVVDYTFGYTLTRIFHHPRCLRNDSPTG